MPKSIGIDIGSRFVRLVELETTPAGHRLTSACTIPTALFADEPAPAPTPSADGEDDDGLMAFETRLERAAQAGLAVGSGVVGFTGRNIMLRYSRIPQGPEHRMRMLIDFEIKEMIGDGGDPLSSAYRRLNLEGVGGENTVLVALSKTDYLEDCYEKLRSAGVKPRQMTVASVGLYNAFMIAGPTLELGETALVASIGFDSTEIAIVTDGACIFARNVNLGGKLFSEVLTSSRKAPEAQAYRMFLAKGDITPPARGGGGSSAQIGFWGAGDQVFRALESSVNFAKLQLRQPKFEVDKVFITGEVARVKGCAQFFESRFKKPVELFDPIKGLDEPKLPAAAKQGDGNPLAFPHQYAVAIGLARIGVEKEPFTVPFSSEAATRRSQFVTRTLFLYLGAIVGLIGCAMLLVPALKFESASAEVARDLQQKAATFPAEKKAFETAVKDRDRAKPPVQVMRSVAYSTPNMVSVLTSIREVAASYSNTANDARAFQGELIISKIEYDGPQTDATLPSILTVTCLINPTGEDDAFALRERFIADVRAEHPTVIDGVEKEQVNLPQDDPSNRLKQFILRFQLAQLPPD